MARIKGFAELLPEQELVQQKVIASVRSTFELHGFTPLQTRSIEHLDDLLDQGETDKEIYGVHRLTTDAVDFSWGLHYDLTVPFARYVSDNRGKLVFPFRRYQIQQAWRGERPQKGRFREFIQADADIVDEGELDLRHDAELLLLLHRTTAALPIPAVKLFVNNRKVLEGFYRGLGVKDVASAFRALDKLPKIGADQVIELLLQGGLSSDAAQACITLADIQASSSAELEQVRDLGVTHELLTEGLAELSFVLDEVNVSAAPGSVVAGLHIARGLDYYTGTVVEGVFEDYPEVSSVCSGGRYDNLVSGGSKPVPGVGVSVGISRLMAYCLDLDLFETTAKTPAEVMVLVHNEEQRQLSTACADALRSRGIAALVSDKASAYGKQMKMAEKLGINYVWFPPDSADKSAVDEVKNLSTGDQRKADRLVWQPGKDTDG